MSVIATAACLGSALAFTLSAPSGLILALTGFFGGGTVGGLIGALAVAAFRLRSASA